MNIYKVLLSILMSVSLIMGATAKENIFLNECKQSSYSIVNNELVTELKYSDRKLRRCEFSVTNKLSLNEPFSLQFSFKTPSINYLDHNWHSIFQIHSFPDTELGEKWRCPVIALEVVNGELRMFNRNDPNQLSVLKHGTCASLGNTISSVKVFEGFSLESNKKYLFSIDGILSSVGDGELTISINGQVISKIMGANTYNDVVGPYFKIGVYKPTSWKNKVKISYLYRDLMFDGVSIDF